jgi:hypothetical protein
MLTRRLSVSLLAAAILMTGFSALASSHREAPLIRLDPVADNTDLYAFRSPDAPDTVTIIANYIPYQEPGQAPNYYDFDPDVLYEIHIDNNGDAREDITYQFRFQREVRDPGTFLYNTGPVTTLDDADLNVRYSYSLVRVAGPRRTGNGSVIGTFQAAPYNIGPKSTPDYPALANAAIFSLGSAGKVFAGPRDDPFFVDISAIGDLARLRPIQQLHLVPPMLASANGIDNLKGYNVGTIALQVPITALTSNGQVPADASAANAVIGIWATASRARVTIRNSGLGNFRQNAGGTTQVSRLGMPLTNEVVLSLAFKDAFNSIEPSTDSAVFTSNETFRNRVLDPEICRLYKALYNVDCPPAPRNDLVQVFLTGLPGLNQPPNVTPADMLRLNVAIPLTASPSRLGALAGDNQGFPNGRRLADDVVDIALRVAAGVLVQGFNREPNNLLTDGVDANDKLFLSTFPYVPLPHSGTDHIHHEPGTATP